MYLVLAMRQRKLYPIESPVCRNRNIRATSLQINPHRCVSSCFIPCAAHLVDGIPVLEKMFDTMRRDELVLHLSFKTTALKLNVLPAAVSQLVDPDVAVIICSPRPRF